MLPGMKLWAKGWVNIWSNMLGMPMPPERVMLRLCGDQSSRLYCIWALAIWARALLYWATAARRCASRSSSSMATRMSSFLNLSPSVPAMNSTRPGIWAVSVTCL